MSSPYDVAVAGAGPSGAATALLLARKGYRVLLLDQAHFPRDKACAEYLSPGVREVACRLGVEAAVLSGDPVLLRGMEIVSPRGAILPVEYGGGPEAPRALTVPRRYLDTALVRAARTSGVEVLEGFRARSLLRDGDATCGVEGTHEGLRRAVRARLVIVADGARSTLARALGVARPVRWPVRLGLVAHFSGPAPLSDGFGQMHVAANGYCGVAPLPPQSESGSVERLNVALVVPLDSVRRARMPATAYFDRWIAEHPRLRDLLSSCLREDRVRGIGPIGARCRRASGPGALLVGDAAGFFDPFTGEGIYRALRGAELAAEIGGRALRKADLSAGALRPYDEARAREFRRKEAVTTLVQLFVQCPRLLEYAAPRLRKRHDARETLGLVLGDLTNPGALLRPSMLWRALQP